MTTSGRWKKDQARDQERAGGQGIVLPEWLVWLVALAFILGGLGGFAILDNNEGLYAEIPREMLASGDWRLWIIPHLNGLPYMEKPPLLYWLTALSFALFGTGEWQARVVPALSALGCVFLLLRLGRAAGRPLAGRVAALMFATGVGVVAMAHVLMFDMLLTAMLTAALAQAWRYMAGGDRKHLRIAYAFLALALLAKGLVALVLFGLTVLLFSLLDARSTAGFLRSLPRWFEPGALAVFLLVAAPWHIVASLTEPIFAWFYFVNEHVLRFLGKREPHDYYAGAWWYYLPRMMIYLFPWSFFLPALLAKRVAGGTDGQDAGAGLRLRRFLLAAWVAPLFFFSISSAKANYYLVAVMPFAAMHLAVSLADRGWLSRGWRALPALLVGVLALAVFAAGLRKIDPAAMLWGGSLRTIALATIAGFALLAFAGAWAIRRGTARAELVYVALPAVIVAAMFVALDRLEASVSTRQTARYLQAELPRHRVHLYRNFEEQSSLPFYLGRALPVIDARSNDLFWGNRLRSNEIVITSEQFLPRLQGPVAVVVLNKYLPEFKQTPMAPQLTRERRIGDSTVFSN